MCNAPNGAESSAIFYSIVETAKENGLNPFNYIKYLFEVMPGIGLVGPDAVAALLPWSRNLPEDCYSSKMQEQVC